MKKKGYLYILTNINKTVLYIGVTSNLRNRLDEHFQESEKASKFAAKYKCKYLVYFEEFERITEAIEREKQLKNWHKDWKWNLIKAQNPHLEDLSSVIAK